MNSSEFFMYNLIQVCENYSGSYLIKCTYYFQTTREVGLFIKFLEEKILFNTTHVIAKYSQS